MALNRTMRSLLKKQWTTSMTENNARQHKKARLRESIKAGDSPSYIMDICQLWSDTPQGHEYWRRIKEGL